MVTARHKLGMHAHRTARVAACTQSVPVLQVRAAHPLQEQVLSLTRTCPEHCHPTWNHMLTVCLQDLLIAAELEAEALAGKEKEDV